MEQLYTRGPCYCALSLFPTALPRLLRRAQEHASLFPEETDNGRALVHMVATRTSERLAARQIHVFMLLSLNVVPSTSKQRATMMWQLLQKNASFMSLHAACGRKVSILVALQTSINECLCCKARSSQDSSCWEHRLLCVRDLERITRS